MYGLALRTVLAGAQGPVAGQSYRAEELNKEGAIVPPRPPEDPRREAEAKEAAAEPLGSKEKRADDFKLRLKLRKAAIAAEKEKRKAQDEAAAEAALIAEAEARFAAMDTAAAIAPRPVNKDKGQDPYANMDLDFDFEGDGTPFRFARGKASRVPGGKDGVRLARAQLRGEETMKLALKDGTLKHSNPVTPFGGLGISGLLTEQDVRTEFRDYIVGWVQEALAAGTQVWGPEGLRFASMGSQKLLFDLELIERIRALGVHVAQICIIDPELIELNATLRQGLREFADWQRATAQVSKEEPAEIMTFSSLEDYHEVTEDGRRASGCHLFVHCQAAWGDSVVLDRRRQMIRGMTPGGLFVRLINDYSSKQANASAAEPTNAEGWFSAGAWTIAPGKPPSITPIRKTLYAGILGAIANVPASRVEQAKLAAEAKMKAQREREQAVAQRRMKEEQERAQADAAKREAELEEAKLSKAQRQARARQKAREQGQAEPETIAEEEQDDLDLDCGRVSRWRVVFKPHIAVRNAPRRTAMIVGALYPGEEILMEDSKRVDNWLCLARAPKRPPGAEIPKESFVLADSGDGRSIFLEPI